MPTIRVDQDVFEGLQKLAKPFVDSPSSVIRRLLEEKGLVKSSRVFPPRSLDGTSRNGGQEPTSSATPLIGNELTPQSIYESFLLYALDKDFNGKGHKRDVTKSVIDRMKAHGYIGPADLELVATGEMKAENTIAWGRNALKDLGHISRISPRGIWELTPEGREVAKQIELPRNKRGSR